MTEWWLRKAVICHLSPIFCNYYFIRDGIPTSPLTRSVGSVTSPYFSPFFYLFIFQLTRSVGSVTTNRPMTSRAMQISTHTLRGERDDTIKRMQSYCTRFQLTRSVGSVTRVPPHMVADLDISTHTLRGERDIFKTFTDCSIRVFQLTRSVGSVTRIRLGHTNSIRISTHTLRGERDSISYNCSPTPIT